MSEWESENAFNEIKAFEIMQKLVKFGLLYLFVKSGFHEISTEQLKRRTRDWRRSIWSNNKSVRVTFRVPFVLILRFLIRNVTELDKDKAPSWKPSTTQSTTLR